MSGNTTAIERLLEMSNKLWDAMYESGEVPTYGERAHYYLALKDAMDENAKLRMFISLKETCWKYVGWCNECPYNGVDDEHGDCNCTVHEKISSLANELGIEAD